MYEKKIITDIYEKKLNKKFNEMINEKEQEENKKEIKKIYNKNKKLINEYIETKNKAEKVMEKINEKRNKEKWSITFKKETEPEKLIYLDYDSKKQIEKGKLRNEYKEELNDLIDQIKLNVFTIPESIKDIEKDIERTLKKIIK